MTATIRTKAQAKAFFETGDTPTQSEFDDIVTSVCFVNDNQVPVLAKASAVTPSSGYQGLVCDTGSSPTNELTLKTSSSTYRKIRQPIIFQLAITAATDTDYYIGLSPSQASTVRACIVNVPEAAGNTCDVTFKFIPQASSSKTSINTAALSVDGNAVHTIYTATLVNTAITASSLLLVTIASQVSNPNLLIKIEMYED